MGVGVGHLSTLPSPFSICVGWSDRPLSPLPSLVSIYIWGGGRTSVSSPFSICEGGLGHLSALPSLFSICVGWSDRHLPPLPSLFYIWGGGRTSVCSPFSILYMCQCGVGVGHLSPLPSLYVGVGDLSTLPSLYVRVGGGTYVYPPFSICGVGVMDLYLLSLLYMWGRAWWTSLLLHCVYREVCKYISHHDSPLLWQVPMY